MKNGILQFKTAAVIPTDRRSPTRPSSFPPGPRRIVVPFSVKAETIDEEARTFEGLASVWGLDLGDDVMHQGAFKKTIGEWKKGTDALPLLNSHNHFDIMSAVGQLLDAKETKDGLWTKWEIIPGPDGDRVLDRVRPGTNGRSPVSKMSIGYEPTKVDFEESDEARFGQVRNLREVRLKETSLVLFPMAPGARIDVGTVKQFLADANAIDAVDDDTKAELRRLATRIGKLLANKSATSAPPAAAAEAIEQPEPESDAPASANEGGSSDNAEEPTDPIEGKENVYLYGDALKQRLLGLKLSSTVNQTGQIK